MERVIDFEAIKQRSYNQDSDDKARLIFRNNPSRPNYPEPIAVYAQVPEQMIKQWIESDSVLTKIPIFSNLGNKRYLHHPSLDLVRTVSQFPAVREAMQYPNILNIGGS
jgi:hypothetical protein